MINEKFVSPYITIRRHNPEGHDLNLHRRANIKSCSIKEGAECIASKLADSVSVDASPTVSVISADMLCCPV